MLCLLGFQLCHGHLGKAHKFGGEVEIQVFHNFVAHMDLLDLSILGRRVTWFPPLGGVMSRLDRVLVFEGWWDRWNEAN